MPVDPLKLWKENKERESLTKGSEGESTPTILPNSAKSASPERSVGEWDKLCRCLPQVQPNDMVDCMAGCVIKTYSKTRRYVIGVESSAPWHIVSTDLFPQRRIPLRLSETLRMDTTSSSYAEALVKAACLVDYLQGLSWNNVTFRLGLLNDLGKALDESVAKG